VLSDSLACVAVHGEGSKPVLRHCLLQNSIERALAVYDYARRWWRNARSLGAPYRCESALTRIPCSALPHSWRLLRRGRNSGSGTWTFEDCDIVENGHHGISVRYSSYAVLSQCRNQSQWLECGERRDNSGATVEHCDLTGNQRPPGREGHGAASGGDSRKSRGLKAATGRGWQRARVPIPLH